MPRASDRLHHKVRRFLFFTLTTAIDNEVALKMLEHKTEGSSLGCRYISGCSRGERFSVYASLRPWFLLVVLLNLTPITEKSVALLYTEKC